MANYNAPSSRYIPKQLVKLIKTSAAIGLKEVKYEHDYNLNVVVSVPQGLPPGTVCRSHRDCLRNVLMWEAKWP